MRALVITGLVLFWISALTGFAFPANIQANSMEGFSPTASLPSDATTISPRPSNGTRLENNTTLPSSAPSHFIDLGDYAILVEKSTQKLYLYDRDYTLIKTFTVTTGQRRGDKKGMGDKKTPEGVYFFTVVKEDKELLPEYGIMALPINYPNFIDTISHKNGNGIWLHATNQPTRPLKPFDTRGCVVAVNEDILELAERIKLQATPMVIVEKIEYETMEKIANTRQEIFQFIKRWQTSWENKDIDSYMDSYSRNFRSNGMDWKGWRKYKDSLNHQYRHITVSLSDVKILRHNNHIVVSFTQRYKNNKLTSRGIKRLYLAHEEEKWKIIGEEWSPIPAQQPAIVAKRYMSHKVAKLENILKQNMKQGEVHLQKAGFEAAPAKGLSPPQSTLSNGATATSAPSEAFLNKDLPQTEVIASSEERDPIKPPLPSHEARKEYSSLKAPIIDIEGFTLDRETAANQVRFKLVNKTMEQYKISGRLAIVAVNKDDRAVRYTSYPPMMLEQGVPKDFRKGEWFSIRRFKIVNGELDKEIVNQVVVLVYSKNGELLLQKEFPIQTRQ